jgi:hypothetical protein
MAIVRKRTLTALATGTAQNLALGFIPSYFMMQNRTKMIGATNGIWKVEWWNDMANGTSFVQTSTAGAAVGSYLATNGITPYQTGDSGLYPSTNLTITGITKAINATITAANNFTTNDYGITTVTFHNVVGMTQINTLSGVVQSATSTSFVVNINTTGYTTYASGGIANIITGIPALQGGLLTSGNAPGFPPSQENTSQVLNTALFNQGTIGLTLGSGVIGTAGDVWQYLALLDADFTSG